MIIGLKAMAEDEPKWEFTGATGLSVSEGNSESSAYHLQLLAEYDSPLDEGRLGADFFFAERQGKETTNSSKLYGQYNHLLSEFAYLGVASDYLRDEVADLDYRVDVSPLLGYYLLKTKDRTLSVEFGPGYTWEKQDGLKDSYASVRLGERFEWSLERGSKIWQTLVWTPEVGDFSNYLLSFELGMDTSLSDDWAFRTFLRHQVDSSPALGAVKNDTSLLFGLSYALGGQKKSSEPKGGGVSPVEVAPKGWESKFATTFALAEGNAESLRFDLSYETEYHERLREAFFSTGYAFGENGGKTSKDQLRSAARYNRSWDEWHFLSSGISYLRDDLADVSYRVSPTLSIGRYLVKNDDLTLSLEGGVTNVFEEVGGVTSDFFSLRSAEYLSWVLSKKSKLNQEFILTSEASDFANMTASLKVTIDTKLTDQLSWRVGLNSLYDNQPAIGREKTDTTLTTGLSLKF